MASVANPLLTKTIQSNNDLKNDFITDDLGMLVSYDGRVIGQHSFHRFEGHIQELRINDRRICGTVKASPGTIDKQEGCIVQKERVFIDVPGESVHESNLNLWRNDAGAKQAGIRCSMRV